MDVKNEIYKSLVNYTEKGFVLNIEKMFVYNDFIVAIIEDYAVNNPKNVNYYYGLYSIKTNKGIPQYSSEYMDCIKDMPTPCKLVYNKIGFMENRILEKEEEIYIQSACNHNIDMEAYKKFLKQYRDDGANESVVSIFNFFIDDDISYSGTDTIEVKIEGKSEHSEIKGIEKDNRNLYKQKLHISQDENQKHNSEQKKNHTLLITIFTIIGAILGIMTATILIGPW